MFIFLFNAAWMGWNLFLASIPLLFLRATIKASSPLRKLLFFLLWFIFVPNTLYVLTDINHFTKQWPLLTSIQHLFIVVQYGLFFLVGIYFYLLNLVLFERHILRKKPYDDKRGIVMFVLNTIIGFAIIVGRIQRINSWYIVTDPLRVVGDTVRTLSDTRLMFYAAVFCILMNIIYFGLRNQFERVLRKHKFLLTK